MTIFAVIPDAPQPGLAAKINELFPDGKSYGLNDRSWIVESDSLTQALSEELGVRDGTYGRVLILRASTSGAGYHAKSLWEWLTSKVDS